MQGYDVLTIWWSRRKEVMSHVTPNHEKESNFDSVSKSVWSSHVTWILILDSIFRPADFHLATPSSILRPTNWSWKRLCEGLMVNINERARGLGGVNLLDARGEQTQRYVDCQASGLSAQLAIEGRLYYFFPGFPPIFSRDSFQSRREKCHDPNFVFLALSFAVDPFNCTPNTPLPRICSCSYAIRALVTGASSCSTINSVLHPSSQASLLRVVVIALATGHVALAQLSSKYRWVYPSA